MKKLDEKNKKIKKDLNNIKETKNIKRNGR
jgi:hypothetical protein